jgi:hypothetical protein
VSGKKSYITAAFMLAGLTVLAGCAVQPDTIVSNDEALCRYSELAGGTNSFAQCRNRLERQRAHVQAASATRVEGYALLQGPAVRSPSELAEDCKKSGKPCSADDATGSIPAEPKQ